MNNLKKVILATVGILTMQTAVAYDGQVSGQIDMIQSASSAATAAFSFSVSLKNAPALCGNSNTSAYLLNTDSNYRLNSTILLTAKSLGSTVSLSSNRDANGYCQIMQLSIQ